MRRRATQGALPVDHSPSTLRGIEGRALQEDSMRRCTGFCTGRLTLKRVSAFPAGLARLRSGQVSPAAALLALLLAVVPLAPAWAQQIASATKAASLLTVERIYGQPSLSGSLNNRLEGRPDRKLRGYFQRSGEGSEAKTEIWGLDVATGKRDRKSVV